VSPGRLRRGPDGPGHRQIHPDPPPRARAGVASRDSLAATTSLSAHPLTRPRHDLQAESAAEEASAGKPARGRGSQTGVGSLEPPSRARGGCFTSFHRLEQMVDLPTRAGRPTDRRCRVRRRQGPGQGLALGVAATRRHLRFRVSRDPMDLNKWWICGQGPIRRPSSSIQLTRGGRRAAASAPTTRGQRSAGARTTPGLWICRKPFRFPTSSTGHHRRPTAQEVNRQRDVCRGQLRSPCGGQTTTPSPSATG